MITLKILTTETPVGPFHTIMDSDNDIVRVSGFGEIGELTKRLPHTFKDALLQTISQHPYQESVQAYFKGDESALDAIPRLQVGTEFQLRVWRAISSIGYGKTLDYSQLAALAGNPKAMRAAGSACGHNRLILLIPCHRVLKKDGSVGSYVYGPKVKEYLLNHEK